MSIANTVQSPETKKELGALTSKFDKAILSLRELDLGAAADKFIKEVIIPDYHKQHAEVVAKGVNGDADITFEKKTRAKRVKPDANAEVPASNNGTAPAATAPTPKTTKGNKKGGDGSDMM